MARTHVKLPGMMAWTCFPRSGVVKIRQIPVSFWSASLAFLACSWPVKAAVSKNVKAIWLVVSKILWNIHAHTYTCACPHHIHVPTTHSHTDTLMPDMMAHPCNLSSPEVAVGGSVVQSQLHSQFGDSQNYMIAIFKVCFRREMIRT